MTKWVYEGGTFIGVDEPSAVEGYDSYFRMAPVLGVDKDIIDRVCHGQWSFEVDEKAAAEVMPQGSEVSERVKCHLTDGKAVVLAAKGNNMSSFSVNNQNTKMLLNLILQAGGEAIDGNYLTDNADMECAYYPESRTLIVINNTDSVQETTINTEYGTEKIKLEAFDTLIKKI